MALYLYKAYDEKGHLTVGEIEAKDRNSAFEGLDKLNLYPFEIKPASNVQSVSWWRKDLFQPRQIKVKDLAEFANNMSVLLSAELPLVEVLSIIKENTGNKHLSNRYNQILSQVLSGSSLSDALKSIDNFFPPYFMSMVEAGEASGSLNIVFKELSSYLEASLKTREQIKSSLVYPIILIIMAILAAIIIFTILIPSIAPIFEGRGESTPFLVSFALSFEGFISDNFALIGLAICLGISLFLILLKNISFREKLDFFILKFPFIGPLYAEIETARLSRTLAILLKNGVPLLQSLNIIQPISKSEHFKKIINEGIANIKEGDTLNKVLQQNRIFPALAARLISLGEKVGNLEEMLVHTANVFDAKIKQKIKIMMTLLTPIITLMIGLGIGVLIVSVMDAILSVNDLAFQ